MPNGLGIAITEEMIEDRVLESMGNRYTQALADSMGTTKEAIVAGIFGEQWHIRDWEKEIDFD